MADFSLTQLRYFCSAASTGTLVGAAAERHVSATAVGAAIDALEAAFGSQLCVRQKSRGIQLTPTGRMLYEEALPLLAAAERLGLQVRSGGTELTGTVTVGCFNNLAPMLVPSLLSAFTAEHPQVELTFEMNQHSVLVESMKHGDVDWIIGYQAQLPDTLNFAPLFTSTVRVIVHPEHPLAHRARLTLEDLRDEPMILYQSAAAAASLPPMFGPYPLDFDVRFRSSQIDLVRAMVFRGLGFSLTWEPVNAPGSRAGRNVSIPLDSPWPDEAVSIAWNREVRPYPHLTEFIRTAMRLESAGQLIGAA